MTTETGRRQPGRPRRYAPGRVNLAVRVTPQRHEDLKVSAIANGRSISEEIEARVERSFTDDVLEKIRRGIDDVARENADIGQELLQRALSRAEVLQARIDELQRERALSEEAIERVIDRALARAFAKLGGGEK